MQKIKKSLLKTLSFLIFFAHWFLKNDIIYKGIWGTQNKRLWKSEWNNSIVTKNIRLKKTGKIISVFFPHNLPSFFIASAKNNLWYEIMNWAK